MHTLPTFKPRFQLLCIILFHYYPLLIQSLQIPLIKTVLSEGISTNINNNKYKTIMKTDMKMQFPFIYSNNSFNVGTKLSNISYTISLPFQPQTLEVSILTTSLSIPQANNNNTLLLNNIHLYYFDNNNKPRYSLTNTFPLAPTYHNNNFSIIHQIYLNKLITEESFGIIPSKNYSVNSLLFIGERPSFIKHYHSRKCYLKPNSNKWSCTLNHILVPHTINNKMKIYKNSNNNIAYFDSSIQYISVPKDFISFLKTEILHPYIINQSCIVNGYFNLRQIECDCDIINDSTFYFELTFIFNDIKLTIPKHLLFEQYGKTCGMLIEENTSTKTEWILGEPIFKQYYMQFNLNEQSITFYISSSYTHNLLLTLITLYKFIIIFLIINSLFILIPYIHILK